MSWRNVRLIFLREVRDQLRDRRTLFMIAVLPLLLYPALGVGVIQLSLTFSEQPRTVVVLGAEELPPPLLLRGDRFISNWFDDPAKADRLQVISDTQVAIDDPRASQKKLASAREVLQVHRQVEQLQQELSAAQQAGNAAKVRELRSQLDVASRQRSLLFGESGIQVLIAVPEGMREELTLANERIRRRELPTAGHSIPKPIVLYNVADEKSLAAYNGVNEAISRWEEQLLRDRLRLADLPESLPSEVNAEMVDLARADERSAVFWSKLFPALLVLMTVTGAFYPAVDLAAGEKERGTMETLLICPASRSEIVLGKFFTVMVFSVGTALLNLASMGFTGKYMSSFAAGGLSRIGSLAPPPLTALVWVAVLMIPLAALFSALCLSLATFARSTKEGQYYLTPLLLVTIGLTVFCLSPAVEIGPMSSMLPVAGVALLLKELLSNGSAGYAYLAPVLMSSLSAAAIALWWAIEQFSREEVLFREAERFEPGLWLRHLLRDKEFLPSFSEAGVCFVLIMLLQFGAIKFLSAAAGNAMPGQEATHLMKLMLIQQIAIIATPALFMGVLLTRGFRQTFRLRGAKLRFFAAAAVLPFVLQPLAVTLMNNLRWFFPQLPPSARKAMEAMAEGETPLWLALLAFAVAPAICEELAFRGFILSGFLRGRRVWLAVVLSALCFGIVHMIPQQVFNASLMGLVLGLLAIRSGSLLPPMLFHLLFNGQQVVLTRLAPQTLESTALGHLVQVQDGELAYSWPMLIVCGLVSLVMLVWLVRKPAPRIGEERRIRHAPHSTPASMQHPVQVS